MRARVAVAAVSVMCGCAAAPASPSGRRVVPPAVVETATEPESARWVFGHGRLDRGRALPLPDGALLVPGAGGQRWIVRGSALEHAATVFPEELVAVLRGPEATFEFVGASGTFYRTQTPLGPLFEQRAPDKPFDSTTASSDIAIGIRDGALFRSVNRGLSYDLTLQGLPGRASEVVLARDGSGLLLMVPQRLFATRDHGATWTQLSLPVAPMHLALADDGTPYVGPRTAARRLLPGANNLAPPIALASPEQSLWDAPPGEVEAIAMEKETVVAVARNGADPLQVSVSRLTERRHYRPVHGLASCDRAVAAAASDHVVAGCVVGGASPSLRVARSYDAGATWKVSSPYDLHADAASARALAAGPKGALLFAGRKGPTLIATETAAPVELYTDGSVLTAARFHDATGRIVFASSDEKQTEVFTAAFDGSDLTDRGKFASHCVRVALDVDEREVIRLGCALKAMAPSTTEYLFPLYALPGDKLREGSRSWGDRPTFALGGGRALVADNGHLHEGSKGLESLAAIGVAPAGPFACSATGCAFATASRIGWDPPTKKYFRGSLSRERLPVLAERPGIKLRCTQGKVSNVLPTHGFGVLDLTNGSDIAYRLATPTGAAWTSWKQPTLQSLSFFPKAKGSQTVHHDLPNGFVSLQYRVTEQTPGKPPLVAATLGWARGGKTNVTTASLGTIGRFAIAEGSADPATDLWPWSVGIVGDDVIIKPVHPYLRGYDAEAYDERERGLDVDAPLAKEKWVGAEPFYLVTASGKISKVAPPAFTPFGSVVFRGDNRWYVVSRHVTKHATVSVDVSSDLLGTSWERREVRLWTPDHHAAFTLTEIDGKPAFVVVPPVGTEGWIATLATDGSHDTSVRRFEIPPLDLSHACSTTAGELCRAHVVVPFGVSESVVTSASKTWVHDASLSIAHTGTACWDALQASGTPGLSSWLIPLRDPRRSVMFEDTTTRTAECVPVP